MKKGIFKKFKGATALLLAVGMLVTSVPASALTDGSVVEERTTATENSTTSEIINEGIMPVHDDCEDCDDEHDHEHDTDTTYTITLADDERNQNGTMYVKISCPAGHDYCKHEEGAHDLTSTSAIVSPVYNEETGVSTWTVHAGDQIVIMAKADSGYALVSREYVRTGRENVTFAAKVLSADTTLKDTFGAGYVYGFTMPEYDITMGCYFANKTTETYINNIGSPDKNAIAGVGKMSPTESISLIMNEAWVCQSSQYVGVDAYLDARFVDLFEEDDSYTMHLEARAITRDGSGYRVIAKLEKSIEEWIAICEDSDTTVDDSGRQKYILEDLQIPILDDANLTLEDEIYCTIQVGNEAWTNAFGAPAYKWGYSGGDYAFVLDDEAEKPQPMIWVNNLDPETYYGEKVIEAVEKINEKWDMDIQINHVTPDVMNEKVGALAGWPGYEFENAGSSNATLTGKYLIYCNLPSIVREELGNYISRACRNVTTAKLTKSGAEDTFGHMFGHLDEESEIFSAAYRLTLAAYNAEKDVDSSSTEYGQHWTESDWETFNELLAEAKVMCSAPEGTYEGYEYRELATEIMEMHMDFLGDKIMNYDFRFVIQEYDEENYKVTVEAPDFDREEGTYKYYWSYFDNPTLSYQIVPKDELYRVMCTVSSTLVSTGNFQTIYMSNPENPQYTITRGKTNIAVTFAEYDYTRDDVTHSYTLWNRPETKQFIAKLYDASGNLLDTQERDEAGTIDFTGLSQGTKYVVKLYAANEVGRTDILTETVWTTKKTSSSSSSSGSNNTTAEKQENETNTDATTVTDVKVELSEEAINKAGEKDGKVELDIVAVKASQNRDDATKIEVKLPSASKAVKVEIPVEKVSAGTVAILVHEDGTEEVIRQTIASKDGIIIPLSGDATIKIVDNAKSFEDTKNHWANESIDFATSRELFAGTSGTEFSPNTSMTRAMLMTVLARFDGEDTNGGANWAENGMNWAKMNGISDGSNPDGNVSREQLASMLYRYAGAPEVSTSSTLGFNDGVNVSEYAEKAMNWAIENGIIVGSNGKLNPQDHATRAQVAAILQRFAEL